MPGLLFYGLSMKLKADKFSRASNKLSNAFRKYEYENDSKMTMAQLLIAKYTWRMISYGLKDKIV